MSPKDFFPRRLDKVSISRIKKTMSDVSYLSDDLVFLPMSAEINPTAIAPRSIDGFAAIIMLSGEAVVQINTKSYTIKPNTILFFSPESVIRTERASSSAAGYFLAYSKTFINRVQVGLSTSLPVFMHYRKSPILKINEEDVHEVLAIFRLMKLLLRSDKKLYRNGQPVQEDYVQHTRRFTEYDNFGPITVPADSYFAMGDNRDNSLDSRDWGFVPRSAIHGKAWRYYWSWDSSTNTPRWSRIGRSVH